MNAPQASPNMGTITFPKAIVYPGRTAQSSVEGFPGATLHGFSPPAGVEVLHLIVGDANLRPKEGETWADLLGEGLAIPAGWATISIRATDDAAHEAEVLMYVSSEAAPPAPTAGPRKTITTTKGRTFQSTAAKAPKARVRRWDTSPRKPMTKTERNVQHVRDQMVRSKYGPDDELDLVLSVLQRQMVVDLVERKVQVPLTAAPAVLHAIISAPKPGEKPRTNAFRIAKKHLDALAAHMQRKAPLPPENRAELLRVLHHESPIAHRPRVVGTEEARRIADAAANGIITVEAESVTIGSGPKAAAEPESDPKALTEGEVFGATRVT